MAEVVDLADAIGGAARIGEIGEELIAAEGATRSIIIGNMEAGLSNLAFDLGKNFPNEFSQIIETTIGDAKIVENDIMIGAKRIPVGEFNGYTKALANDGDFLSFYKKILPEEEYVKIADQPSFVQIMDDNKKIFEAEKPRIRQVMGKPENIVVPEAERVNIQQLDDNIPSNVRDELETGISNGDSLSPEEAESIAENLTDAEKEQIEKAVEGSKYLKEIKEALTKKGGDLGKWVVKNLGKVVIGITAAGLAIYIYYQVKQHQNELNGCWAIDKNGKKFKVPKYTCNQGDRNNTKQPITLNCKCSIAQERCADSGSGSCAECCATNECQDPNISLTCNSADFAKSAGDLAGKVPAAIAEASEGITKNILKVIGMIILVIVAIFVLYFVFNVVMNFIKSSGGKKRGSDRGSNGSFKDTYGNSTKSGNSRGFEEF
jgi:hypothetical protein